MIKKIVLAFYRTLLGVITLLFGALVVVYTLVWDSVKTHLLKRPKTSHPNFDRILEEELERSKNENTSQPTSTPVEKK